MYKEELDNARNHDRLDLQSQEPTEEPSAEEEITNAAPLAKPAGAKGAAAHLQKLSEEALRQSWLNLIPSVGFTFIYIIFHFIFHYLGGPLSEFFCKPGKEGAFGLVPKINQPMGGKMTSQNETIEAGSEYAELVVFGAICLLLLIVTLLIVGLVVAILQVLKII